MRELVSITITVTYPDMHHTGRLKTSKFQSAVELAPLFGTTNLLSVIQIRVSF